MLPSFKHLKQLLLLASSVIFLSGCATTATGRDQLNLVSDKTVEQTATYTFENLKRSQPHSIDPKEVSYVTCIVDALTGSMNPPQKWEVAIFENDEANASAFAGGKIGLNSGMFRVALNSDQLAVVLSHEIAHVVLHHGRERMSEQMAVDTLEGLSHLSTLSHLGVASTAAQFGTLYLTSQTQEFEADVTGLDLVARSGFNPSEALKFWENMQVYGVSEYLISGHASTERRIANLKKYLPEAKRSALTAHSRPNCPVPALKARMSLSEMEPALAVSAPSSDELSPLKSPPIIGSASELATLRGGLHLAKTAYSVWGFGVGAVLGLGLGHAVQGHYLENGWKWSMIDIGLITGIVLSQDCSTRTTHGMVDGVYTINRTTNCDSTPTSTAALIGLIGSHIWQGIELWRQPKKLIQMTSHPQKNVIRFQQPVLMAYDDSIGVGAIWSW